MNAEHVVVVALGVLIVGLLCGMFHSLGWLKCYREGTVPALDGWGDALDAWCEFNDADMDAVKAAEAWRAVAVTFAGDAADEGVYLPTDPVILAYNHARNGRYAEALEVLA